MKAIKVSDIAQIVDGQLHGDGEGIVTSVVIDSRKVQNDSMFAAFPGEKVDGHDYIGKAFESGASCCIGNFVPEGETRPMIIVEDVQKALKVLATWYRNTLTIPVIGITGSVGKTTTKEMVSSVLESRFKVLKTEANLNNELGVPLTIFRIEPEHDVAVIEMGISHFQEMTRLAQMAQPDIGIFTVIGYAHLENLGSREGILWAKTEMVKYMQPDGVMVVNGDDDLLYQYPAERDKITYGTQLRCKVRASEIEMTEEYTSCTITNGERTLPVRIHAYGNHIIYAALAAVTVGFQFGLSDDEIRNGLLSYETVGRRANVVRTDKLILIDDCYNANPGSVKSALDSMEHFAGRHVAILGDMFELGDNENALHAEIGAYAVEHGAELVLTVGGLSVHTAEGARKAGGQAEHYDTKEELISQLDQVLREGDIVLVKASHSMEFEKISEAIKNQG